MKLVLVQLFILFGMIQLAKQSKKQRMSLIRQAYYSDLSQFTIDLFKKVSETKIKLEEKIPEKLKLRHEKLYRKNTKSVFRPQKQNEAERLNRQANELKSFVHRVKLARSAEQNVKGNNLASELMSIEVKLRILRMLLHRLMKKSHIKTKLQPNVWTVKNSKLQTLTTLNDLQTSLAFMTLDFRRAKKPH